MRSARIISGVAVDVVDGDPVDTFPPDLAAQFAPVPDIVRPQWRLLPTIVDHQPNGPEDWFQPYAVIEAYEHEVSPGVTETRHRLVDRTPAPRPPAPASVPAKVTRRQARQALFLSGVSLATVDALIDALPEPSRTVSRIFWEDSNDFERTNSTLNAMAAALNLTPPQLDDLFRLAQTL